MGDVRPRADAAGDASRLPKESLSLYVDMLRIRMVEERVAELLEAGEIKCPVHLCTGQEAIAVGICSALKPDDMVFGGHRSHGHYLAKGGGLDGLVAELYATSRGCSGGRGGSMHLIARDVGFMGTVPLIGATVSLSVGAALSSILRGLASVTVAFFGDGALEEGTVHESLNLAAHRKLPVIFVCENNFFSSHMRLEQRRVKDNLVDSATAHGIPGIRVDGNDVFEVRAAATEAVARARNGGGPSFLECRTYRWRGHVGPSMDFDVGVRRKDELKEWQAKDPIGRLRGSLIAEGVTLDTFNEIEAKVSQDTEAAIDAARASSQPPASEVLSHVISDPAGSL